MAVQVVDPNVMLSVIEVFLRGPARAVIYVPAILALKWGPWVQRRRTALQFAPDAALVALSPARFGGAVHSTAYVGEDVERYGKTLAATRSRIARLHDHPSNNWEQRLVLPKAEFDRGSFWDQPRTNVPR